VKSQVKQWFSLGVMAVLAWFVCILFPVSAHAQSKLIFTTFPSEGMGELLGRILIEAYSRIGYEVEVRRVPAARALIIANSGLVDGEAARVAVIERANMNLIRVPTPIYLNTIVAYSRNRGVDTSLGWQMLHPYRLASVRGYKFIERMTATMDRTLVLGHDRMFSMLRNGRVDIAIAELLESLPCFLEYGPEELQLLDPPLSRQKMYHYLHQKHADLVPKIDTVLKQMEEAGEIQAFKEQLFEEIRNR